MTDDLRPPYRISFDNARDPYAARNALGVIFPLSVANGGTGATTPSGALANLGAKVGTTTNDDAAAGDIGEYIQCIGTGAGALVTISNASPAVITDAAHGLNIAQVVSFTTTGTLPTGITVGTNYYVSSQGYAAGAYSISTSVADALVGTSVNTSSAGSGSHTRTNLGVLTTVTNLDIGGFSLTAGDWDVDGLVRYAGGATTTINSLQGWTNTATATLTGTMFTSLTGYNSMVITNATSLILVTRRYSLASPTTIFGTARANFGTSTLSAAIAMRARRVR